MIGRLVEVGSVPLDGAEVSFLSSLSEPGELEILVHALTKPRGHEWVLSRQKEVKTVWNPLSAGHRGTSVGKALDGRTPRRLRHHSDHAKEAANHPAAKRLT